MAYNPRYVQAAQRILADELVGELFNAIRNEQFATIAGSQPGEKELREHCYATVRMVDVLRQHLMAIASDVPHAQQAEQTKRMMS